MSESVAVCITGQLRAATCRLNGAGAHSPTAIETIAAFLRRELPGSDAFVVLDAPPADAAAAATHAAAVKRVTTALRPVEVGFDDAGAAHAAYTQVRTSGACLTLSAVAQARKLEMCLRMIEAAEEKRAASRGGGSARYYTHLLRLRPDTMMPAHLNLSRYGLALRRSGDRAPPAPPTMAAPRASRAPRSSYLGPTDGSEGLLTPDTCIASRRSQVCHARCTRVLHKHERVALERRPAELLTVPPYTGKVHEETFLNDIFYLATRDLATPMLGHLQAGLRWAREEAGKEPARAEARAAGPKASACAGARLPLAPRCSPSGTEAAAEPGLCTTGGHECLLTLGLLRHHHRRHHQHQTSSRPLHVAGGSSQPDPLRVRYLSQADWPKLLRLAETDAGCAPYRQAYECTEKAKIQLRLANLTGRAAAAAVISRCSKAQRERHEAE